MERRIRNFVKVLIIEDRKMLVIKIDDDGDVFYILFGGS